jgi:two-component sensor histidine kinase
VRLSTSLALTLAMALQELVTNAVKYGSLSTPTGKVRVTWSVEPKERHSLLGSAGRRSAGPG